MVDSIEKSARGHQAQAILSSELFREVLDGMDAEYHARWRKAQTVEAREDLYRYVKVLERLTADLQSIANTGVLEDARIKELEGAKQRKVFAWQTR